MLTCGALVATGAALAWRWRAFTLALPRWAEEDTRSLGTPARALVWLLGVGLLTGLLVGALIVGPAGRLAMRLLAATSPDAQGRLTEAGEVVGRISIGGTVGFFVFVGLPFGLAVGIVYALTSFVLPRGAVGGALFGAAVLVIFGSMEDPLRQDNRDFDIVGPGWLSVVTFCAMALLTGVLTVPIAGRIGAALQTPRGSWALWMVPVGLVAVAALAAVPVALVAVLVGCLVFFAAVMVVPAKHHAYRRRARLALQAALAVVVAAALPGFVAAIADIAG